NYAARHQPPTGGVNMAKPAKPITPGQRFGYLTALERAANDQRGRERWRLRCTCGKEIVTRADFLRGGAARSCGCRRNYKHGYTGSLTWVSWQAMLDRCYRRSSKSFTYYGGRGVTVCDSWRNSFAAFLSDMGSRPSARYTLDRIDPTGNYNPENCRWATRSDQARFNRRRTGHGRKFRGVEFWL